MGTKQTKLSSHTSINTITPKHQHHQQYDYNLPTLNNTNSLKRLSLTSNKQSTRKEVSSSTLCLNNQQQQHQIQLRKFGISPRIKRKIVEAINKTNEKSQFNNNKPNPRTNLINRHSKVISNSIFSQFSNKNKQKSITKRDNDTFISCSLRHNSQRYASRRKYKTQSLSDPFRHAHTNYPVYTHESLFLPEFSVKGKVTEGDFEICDIISRGAFGHVIKVMYKLNKTQYAMKIMWKSQIIKDRALQQVKDEVTIASSCSTHEFIVPTWFYWQSKRFLYIITSYINNGELLSLWLKLNRLPLRLVAIYAIEMALVLDYLHNKGIIYRDIKMENILLDDNGHLKLIDFGLSKWLPLGDRTTTICGTIQYMSPEILSVEPYTHAVDYWSLGILLWALLTGEYPLNAAKDHIQMSSKVKQHSFELRGDFDTNACYLINNLLKKNPHNRLKSLNELKYQQFFKNEYKRFFNENTQLENQSSEFWTSKFIINHYEPFKILFDELQQESQLNDSSKTSSSPSSSSSVSSSSISPLTSSDSRSKIKHQKGIIKLDQEQLDDLDKNFEFFD